MTMKRIPLIAANWKMHKTIGQAIAYVKEFKDLVKKVTHCEIVLCPAFTALADVAPLLQLSNIKLGAQNLFFEKEGAYTGEISPIMLKEIGCSYVIIGHSERRQWFKEDDELINKKVVAALNSDLIPILCIGETLKERGSGKTEAVVKEQLEKCLKGLSKEKAAKIVVAYEPVWAIGTGKNAAPDQAESVHVFIRKLMEKIADKETAEQIRILYGGSVNSANIKGFMAKKNIDGALVGSASLDAKEFSSIVGY